MIGNWLEAPQPETPNVTVLPASSAANSEAYSALPSGCVVYEKSIYRALPAVFVKPYKFGMPGEK
jgi:hypothetical protein